MLEKLTTELRNPKSMELDNKSIKEVLLLMNEEDATVPLAVKKEIDNIESVVKEVVKAFKNGGRLIYVGAGTSGRLGILDASECPPTFGVEPTLVQGLIAGGEKAILKAIEGAEDDEESGQLDLKAISINEKDVVVG